MMPALLTSDVDAPEPLDRGVDERLRAGRRSTRRWCRRPRRRPRRRSRPRRSTAGPASAPSPSIEPPRSLTTTLAPRSREQQRVGAADAAARAGDDRDAPLEAVPVHVRSACRGVYRPVTLHLGPRLDREPVSRPLLVVRPHRRHHAQPPRGPQRGRSRDGARPRGRGRPARGRPRRLGRGAVRQHRRSGAARSSAPAPTSRSSGRRVPRRRSTPSAAGSAGSCTASARSRSWSPSTVSRPRWSGDRPRRRRRRGDHPIAFGLAEVRHNLIAAAGGLFRLPRAIGRAAAMDAILTGEPIDARRAFDLGLVSRLVEPGAALDEALRVARQIVAAAPLAVRASRRVVLTAAHEDDDTLRQVSRELLDELLASEDASEGLLRLRREAPAAVARSLMPVRGRGTVEADGADRGERRSRRSAKWKARRDAIVDTSAQVFARRGYHATGIAELCEVNGFGKGAFYYYIGSKEELLAAIHDRVMDEVMLGADRVADAGGSPSEQLDDARRRAARRHPPLSRPRVGVPPRVPRAHRGARRAVPHASARVRAQGRGGLAGRHRRRGVPRRRPVADGARVARHAQLHVSLAQSRRSRLGARRRRSRSPTSSSAGSSAQLDRPAQAGTGASKPRRPPRVPPIMAAFSSAGTPANSWSISSRLPRNVPSACG